MEQNDYRNMQASAAERVRDMQRKADAYTAAGNRNPAQKPPPRKAPEPPAPKVPEPPAPTPTPIKPQVSIIKNRGAELLNMLNFKGIDMDADRALILGMMLLLISQSDDELLILALIYIML